MIGIEKGPQADGLLSVRDYTFSGCDFTGRRVLVTGGAGFIGSHIVAGLLSCGADYVCVIDDMSGCSERNVDTLKLHAELTRTQHNFDVYRFGCESYTRLLKEMQHLGIDTVVHAAANARESASQFQPFAVTKSNLYAYSSVISAAISSGVKNVVLFSSFAIYGDAPVPYREDMLPVPVDVYATNKLAMEHVTKILCDVHGLNYVIMRPHNVFGPMQSLSDPFRNAVAIFMNQIMRGEPITVFGDGMQTRAFTYISNAIPYMLKLTEKVEEHSGEIFNVGGDERLSVNQLVFNVLESMRVPDDYPVNRLPTRMCEIAHPYASHDKIVEKVSVPVYRHTSIKEGVDKMAEWAKHLGPQEWVTGDPIEISDSKHLPEHWKR